MENFSGRPLEGAQVCDKAPGLCRGDDKAACVGETNPRLPDDSLLADSLSCTVGLQPGASVSATLPRDARLPINRCNLPAVVLGSLTYQRHPSPLLLDGVAELHHDLFRRLALAGDDVERRGEVFRDYLTVRFQLEWPEEMGYTGRRKGRAKANYARMIRGWSFDSDSREGAVMKGWVESRFGLLPRYHGEPLRDQGGTAYQRYVEMRAQGLYGTNALEAQLDLVYAYCQYEFARQQPGVSHLTLHRGVNHLGEHERLADGPGGRPVLLLNSLNSFTCNRERAGEFGDFILTLQVPVTKVLFHCRLLPGTLQGEEEFLVIGGVYGAECAFL